MSSIHFYVNLGKPLLISNCIWEVYSFQIARVQVAQKMNLGRVRGANDIKCRSELRRQESELELMPYDYA